jgi:cytochrome c oxidase subunit 2
VTSRDVFHTIGSPPLRFKSDAIPGQYTDTWFVADETGEYSAQCFELCGAGHSFMEATVVVMDPAEYQDWYEGTSGNASSVASSSSESRAPVEVTA